MVILGTLPLMIIHGHFFNPLPPLSVSHHVVYLWDDPIDRIGMGVIYIRYPLKNPLGTLIRHHFEYKATFLRDPYLKKGIFYVLKIVSYKGYFKSALVSHKL